MSSSIDCIALPVADLARAARFYSRGLGFEVPEFERGADHVTLELDNGPRLMLVARAVFEVFTEVGGSPTSACGSSGCILTHLLPDRESVELTLSRARAAGGAAPSPPEDRPWGYAAYVADPDGHVWELVYNPDFGIDD